MEPYTIDAQGKILGRVATEAAHILRGKHAPAFEPHKKPLHKVLIIHASGIRVTGNKARDKIYKRFTGYPSGLKETTYEKLMATKPERVLEHAIRGMLPNNKLRARMMKNLIVQL
jgi:large subunit ribosomal protein L13